MKLRALVILTGAALLASCAKNPPRQQKIGDEASLRRVDDHERSLIAARDFNGMRALADPDLHINAPTNKVLTGSQLLARMQSGAVAAEDFVRTPEVIKISGDVGIVMGRERLRTTPDSESGRMFGAGEIDRRFTNIYQWREGQWRFLARHANVVPSAPTRTPR